MFAGVIPAKAIVTGGAGFIGSHLVERLLAEGSEVVVIDDLSTGKEANLPPEADLEVLDVADHGALAAATAAVKPEAIFHLAAQASVTVSVADPWRDNEVNVIGTLNVLECAREAGAPIVFSSTGGALYGDNAPLPTREDAAPVPESPYGASKLAGEAYVKTWGAAHGAAHAICRLGNAYGPRQSPHGEAGVVAIFSHKLWAGEEPVLYGHGKPTRDYVYVSDITDGLVRAAGTSGVFNLGTGTEVPVIEIFESLRRTAGSGIEPRFEDLRPGELNRSALDSSAAAEAFGWRAEVTLQEGLQRTYAALTDQFAAAG